MRARCLALRVACRRRHAAAIVAAACCCYAAPRCYAYVCYAAPDAYIRRFSLLRHYRLCCLLPFSSAAIHSALLHYSTTEHARYAAILIYTDSMLPPLRQPRYHDTGFYAIIAAAIAPPGLHAASADMLLPLRCLMLLVYFRHAATRARDTVRHYFQRRHAAAALITAITLLRAIFLFSPAPCQFTRCFRCFR